MQRTYISSNTLIVIYFILEHLLAFEQFTILAEFLEQIQMFIWLDMDAIYSFKFVFCIASEYDFDSQVSFTIHI